MKNICLALIIGIVIGATFGWFLKGERTIIQVQKVLDKEHTAAVNLEVKNEARKQEVESGIRRAGTHLGDCDRAPANTDTIQTLDRYPH